MNSGGRRVSHVPAREGQSLSEDTRVMAHGSLVVGVLASNG